MVCKRICLMKGGGGHTEINFFINIYQSVLVQCENYFGDNLKDGGGGVGVLRLTNS